MRNTTDKCTHGYVILLHYKQRISLYTLVGRISHNEYQCMIMNHLILCNNIQEIPCVTFLWASQVNLMKSEILGLHS